MAKETKKKKKTSKERNSVKINNWKLLNDFDNIKTEVLHIREQGCLVRDSSKNGITTTWVANVKPKKSGVNFKLIQDTPEQRAAKKKKRDEKKKQNSKKK